MEDLTNKRFNKLTVVKFSRTKNRKDGRKRHFWICKCDCGNLTEVDADHLKSGHTTSCGCRLKEINQDIAKLNYKNGLAGTKLSFVYNNMHNRCNRKKDIAYKHYGGRGIKVCKEWDRKNKDGFTNFCKWALASGYKENTLPNGRNELTLDRIDNDKMYCPNNCRWVTQIEQSNNKSNTLRLKINGEIDTVTNWTRRLNIHYWNLAHYAHGGKNCKYPDLRIEVVK